MESAKPRIEREPNQSDRLKPGNRHQRLVVYTARVSDVTRILDRAQPGEAKAAEELLPLVHEELRKLAALKLGESKTNNPPG